MVSYERLGSNGRAGNMMFQIAATVGLAIKHGDKAVFPKWEYAEFFRDPIDQSLDQSEISETYEEPHFHYAEIPYKPGLNLFGYFQSMKHWDHCEDEIKALFEFKDGLLTEAREKLKISWQKPNIAVMVRRGDYVGNPNYVNLKPEYYLRTLFKHFPDYLSFNIIFFSDDTLWCRENFGHLPNAKFVENNSCVEDLCLASSCDHFILGNSSYHWWAAYLGQKSESIIIRPSRVFEGPLKEKNDEKDFWKEDWTIMEIE